ncbi:MAG: DUF305 domain-containing protein [Acidobacteria bacterium]|nr:DUF305 domain-containing protein [Acidobacteriota bacterium]MCA1637920.1 DUF305 domain-containing protein [Acidobacteriota bacterium]
MKKGVLLSLTVALAVFGAACQQPSTVNTNSAMNQNAVNRNSMNGNSMMNQNSSTMNDNSNMSGMMDMNSSPNAASQPYDLQFIDTMTHHHQGAVDMAKMVLTKSNNEELKKFAQKIIDDQNKEIAQMKDWREKWFAGKPAAMNMEMPGMKDSMKMMIGDGMKRMEATGGKEFDLMFLDMMTPHHAGATTMAKEALSKAEHQETKTLANQIIEAQEAEIKQMADWKAKWSK